MKMTAVALPISALLLLGVGGCAPTGNPGSRVAVSETTPGENPSAGIPLTSLTEFADQAAAQLVSDLNKIPEISQYDKRSTVIMGDINNQTQVVPTNDFTMFRSRLRQFLSNSTRASNQLRFQESRASFDALRQREAPRGVNVTKGEATVDEDHVFLLNGDFYRAARNDTSMYQMSFRLIRFSDGVSVWESAPYDAKFVNK